LIQKIEFYKSVLKFYMNKHKSILYKCKSKQQLVKQTWSLVHSDPRERE